MGDLVDLARDDERPDAEPEAVPFAELVQRAVDRAQRRALSLHFEVSLQPGQVLAQPALLERAVMNVLDNAAKWSPTGGRVAVTLASNGAWHLTVTDEGPGVAPEDLPHIFERFYRAQSARSMPGSGLGLAIVQAGRGLSWRDRGDHVALRRGDPGGHQVAARPRTWSLSIRAGARSRSDGGAAQAQGLQVGGGVEIGEDPPRSARRPVLLVHQDDARAAQQSLHRPLARLHEHTGGEQILLRPAGAQRLRTPRGHRDH